MRPLVPGHQARCAVGSATTSGPPGASASRGTASAPVQPVSSPAVSTTWTPRQSCEREAWSATASTRAATPDFMSLVPRPTIRSPSTLGGPRVHRPVGRRCGHGVEVAGERQRRVTAGCARRTAPGPRLDHSTRWPSRPAFSRISAQRRASPPSRGADGVGADELGQQVGRAAHFSTDPLVSGQAEHRDERDGRADRDVPEEPAAVPGVAEPLDHQRRGAAEHRDREVVPGADAQAAQLGREQLAHDRRARSRPASRRGRGRSRTPAACCRSPLRPDQRGQRHDQHAPSRPTRSASAACGRTGRRSSRTGTAAPRTAPSRSTAPRTPCRRRGRWQLTANGVSAEKKV